MDKRPNYRLQIPDSKLDSHRARPKQSAHSAKEPIEIAKTIWPIVQELMATSSCCWWAGPASRRSGLAEKMVVASRLLVLMLVLMSASVNSTLADDLETNDEGRLGAIAQPADGNQVWNELDGLEDQETHHKIEIRLRAEREPKTNPLIGWPDASGQPEESDPSDTNSFIQQSRRMLKPDNLPQTNDQPDRMAPEGPGYVTDYRGVLQSTNGALFGEHRRRRRRRRHHHQRKLDSERHRKLLLEPNSHQEWCHKDCGRPGDPEELVGGIINGYQQSGASSSPVGQLEGSTFASGTTTPSLDDERPPRRRIFQGASSWELSLRGDLDLDSKLPVGAVEPICGSDGRLYASMCQLKRHSCRHNAHLVKMPSNYCSDWRSNEHFRQQNRHHHRHGFNRIHRGLLQTTNNNNNNNHNDSLPTAAHHPDWNNDQMVERPTTTPTSDPNYPPNSNASEDFGGTASTLPVGTNNSQLGVNARGHVKRVRIIELRRRCSRMELDEMKRLLLREFNGNVGSMFSYLDSNGDNFIEAHELWPRRRSPAFYQDHRKVANGSPKWRQTTESKISDLNYAQIFNDHSNWCHSEFDKHYQHQDGKSSGNFKLPWPKYRRFEHHNKCWFLLDFAFEPVFMSNPCSLSHLMLFDLEHLGDKFSLEKLQKAFNHLTQNDKLNLSDQSSSEDSQAPIAWNSQLRLTLGESATVSCLERVDAGNESIREKLIANGIDPKIDIESDPNIRCLWSRYNTNLATLKDRHIFIERKVAQEFAQSSSTNSNGLTNEFVANSSTWKSSTQLASLLLHLNDVQSYLSGQFKCSCHLDRLSRTFEHVFNVQVLVQPRVSVRPQLQWSRRGSRASFECIYDFIDTTSAITGSSGTALGLSQIRATLDETQAKQLRNNPEELPPSSHSSSSSSSSSSVLQELPSNDHLNQEARPALLVEWSRDNPSSGQQLIVDGKRLDNLLALHQQSNQKRFDREAAFRRDLVKCLGNCNETASNIAQSNDLDERLTDSPEDDDFSSPKDFSGTQEDQQEELELSESSRKASLGPGSSRLSLGPVEESDSGAFTCRVRLAGLEAVFPANNLPLLAEDTGRLLVEPNQNDEIREQTLDGPSLVASGGPTSDRFLWMFHGGGILIYKLQNDHLTDMELAREISGHSAVSAEVDGNWNQLTLCGGLNSEQAVICEWTDNAIYVDPASLVATNHHRKRAHKPSQSIAGNGGYIYVGQSNLNRLIVMDANEFEIVAIINTEPQPRRLFSYKPSELHLTKWIRRRLSPKANGLELMDRHRQLQHQHRQRKTSREHNDQNNNKGHRCGHRPWDISSNKSCSMRADELLSHNSQLVQIDLWLLCYGHPVVVNPSSGDEEEDGDGGDDDDDDDNNNARDDSDIFHSILAHDKAEASVTNRSRRSSGPSQMGAFTPRIGSPPWSLWTSAASSESRVRHRKSVQIIRSTFFERHRSPTEDRRDLDGFDDEESLARIGQFRKRQNNHKQDGTSTSGQQRVNETTTTTTTSTGASENRQSVRGRGNHSAVSKFRRKAIITSHHVFQPRISALSSSTSWSQQRQASGGQLTDSKPSGPKMATNSIQSLFIPERPYSVEHNELYKIHYGYITQFNDNNNNLLFRLNMDDQQVDKQVDLQNCDPISVVTAAQGLVIIQCREPVSHHLTGQLVIDQLTSSFIELNPNIQAQESYLTPDNRYLVSVFANNSRTSDMSLHPSSSIVYVQSVTLDGLKLQYDIKIQFGLSECSFVWLDGYYQAIFLSSDRDHNQSELLSLRLADGRLELMAQLPGLQRHKSHITVSPELKLAAVSTNRGTFVINLEANRLIESFPEQQAVPTIVWV